jgi:hypothetical protein
LRPHEINECRSKLNGLLSDFRNRDGFNEVAEAAWAEVEDEF